VSSKVAMITVTAPYILLIILLIKILLLPGSRFGIYYMTIPDFSKLLMPSVWQSALNQCFFQNTIGSGITLTFASLYGKQSSPSVASGILTFANLFSSILSAIIVFGFIGHFSYESQIPIDELPLSGASLVFVTYPASLALLPFPRFWLAIFFVSLFLLSIDSQIGILESISHFFIDSRNIYKCPSFIEKISKYSNMKIRFYVCLISLLLGLPMCFQSGFRTLTFLNQFCTVVSTSLGLIFDLYLFYFKSGVSTLSSYVQFFLKICIIPLTLSIFITWVIGTPQIIKDQIQNKDYISLLFGFFYNLMFISIPAIFYFK
jgi:SNF family Na+-dependent transporter